MNNETAQPSVLNAMLEKANEKLAAAQEAIRDGFFGEAASCSYYAAFHATSAVLAHKVKLGSGRLFSHACRLACRLALNRRPDTGLIITDREKMPMKVKRIFFRTESKAEQA